jgi:hypothetical protein
MLRRRRFAARASADGVNPKARRLETIISEPVRRKIKQRFGLLGAHDSAYFQLVPPNPGSDEEHGRPDFVGIGVQRAGTSWWLDLLTAQPGIYHRSVLQIHKERQYFSHLALAEVTKARMEDEYCRWFPKPAGSITGEWTPDYFYYSWVPAQLKAAAPDTRLLLILRDPIERMLSGAMHVAALNQGAIPPGDVIEAAFQRGLYALQLRNWLVHFPREQLLVLQYEKCVTDPAGELKRTVEFLGTQFDRSRLDAADKQINATKGRKPHLACEVRERFRELYSADVRELVAMFPNIDLDLWPNFQSEI